MIRIWKNGLLKIKQGLNYWMKYLLAFSTKYKLALKFPRTNENLGKRESQETQQRAHCVPIPSVLLPKGLDRHFMTHKCQRSKMYTFG